MATDRTTRDTPVTACPEPVGNVVARIEGALGSVVLVGLDRLSVCRSDGAGLVDGAAREPWAYAELQGVSIGSYGSLPVILLHLTRRTDPLPILILERGQVSAALDGLVTLRRLISAADSTLASA